MFDAIGDINWLAVIVATLAYYILGAIWFTPLFGRVTVAWTQIEQVFVARPTGVRRADAINIRIPIEGAEWATSIESA